MRERVARLRDYLTASSRLAYVTWRLGLMGRRPVRVCTCSGQRLIIRPAPSTDIDTAMEVFVVKAYSPPQIMDTVDALRIVDLGSNAGFTVVHFATCYPDSRIEAYEPHPRQLIQLRAHVQLNNIQNRVRIRPVAVSNRAVNRMYLIGADAHARLSNDNANRGTPVQVVDWIEEAGIETIDILKLDIEGGEKAILLDPRFQALDIRRAMIEWHATSDWPHAERETKDVLRDCGFQISDGPRGSHPGIEFGIIWAAR